MLISLGSELVTYGMKHSDNQRLCGVMKHRHSEVNDIPTMKRYPLFIVHPLHSYVKIFNNSQFLKILLSGWILL